MLDKLKQEFNQSCAGREMPRYRCKQQVWALKIAEIHPRIVYQGDSEDCEREAMITPVDERYGSFFVDDGYLRRYNPQVGGYYVVYRDGRKSFSPEKDFEEVYEALCAQTN